MEGKDRVNPPNSTHSIDIDALPSMARLPLPCIAPHAPNPSQCTSTHTNRTQALAEGIVERGGTIAYKAHVKGIITEGSGDGLRAVGVRLADGRTFRAKVGNG